MTRFGGRSPLGTEVINVTGSFQIGFPVALSQTVLAGSKLAALAGGRISGRVHCISSFEWETYTAVRAGGFWTGMLNMVASVMLGYMAVSLGSMLARR
jgi:fluoride ion exporter CrcB/FEX